MIWTGMRFTLWILTILILPIGLAASEVEVYVGALSMTGPGNSVLRYTSDGTPLGGFKLPETSTPFGMTTDGTDLFIAIGNSIERYSTAGEFLETIVDLPAQPIHLHRDPAGMIYASAPLEDSAFKLDADGNVITSITGLAGMFGVNGDLDGRIYASLRNELRVYDSDGMFELSVPTDFFFSSDIAIDHDADLLYLMSQPGMMNTYDISGTEPLLLGTTQELQDLAFYANFDSVTGNLFYSGPAAGYQIEPEDASLVGLPYGFGSFVAGIVAVPVPEPGSCFFAAIALGFVAIRRRR